MAKAIESDECKRILDHVPVAIVISWRIANEQRIVYANSAFEELTGLVAADLDGAPWSVLDVFVHEDDPELTLGQAVANGEDLLGTFRADRPGGTSILAQAYAGVIEGEDGATRICCSRNCSIGSRTTCSSSPR
jgi:PAS domain S-box-containing protein